MELYQQALAMNPNSSLALSRLAFGYLNRGENEQAMQFASRAVAIDPTSSEGWIVLGAAQHATGEREKAREAYRNCVEHGQGDYITECRRMAR
jgi:Tfp pilus assembly protein PilF